ncbi:MAG TPA: CotH kinase family protein, partial [Myxococcota bacterium]|nr:CotH kinase family protein [Myxococcota bacterium]
SLRADPRTFVQADLQIDGREVKGIGVRIKGRLGSLRSIDQKAGLKLDFNTLGGTDELSGLHALNLNNMVQDCSWVHERIAYGIYRGMGIPAPRVGYARVTVDGQLFGLYSVVEEYDKTFLKKWYEDPSGNLYDGDYKLWPDGHYTLLDFDSSVQQWFDLDSGTDVGLADISAVTTALDSARTEQVEEKVGPVVDLDHFARLWAVDAWVGHYDSYSYNINNYRVYFDPSDGRADLFPWDPDWAFYESTPVSTPSGRLARACKEDSECHERFLQALEATTAWVGQSDLQEQLRTASELIEPYISGDPRRETDPATIQSCQTQLKAWLRLRGDRLGDMSGL